MSDATAVEPARAEDLPQLAAIAAECGLHIDFAAEFARPYALLRVARSPSGVCGLLLAWRAADELHLTDLGVAAPHRRRGVGRLLLQALCAEGRQAGARAILLEVRENNAAALSLYTGLGFSELARRARYYTDSGEDAVVMQLELR